MDIKILKSPPDLDNLVNILIVASGEVIDSFPVHMSHLNRASGRSILASECSDWRRETRWPRDAWDLNFTSIWNFLDVHKTESVPDVDLARG